MKRTLRTVIVLVVTAVVAVSAVVVGNAAQLPVDAGQISVASASAPCTGTATATPERPHGAQKYDDLRVTLPAGCAGRIQIAVTAWGTLLRSFAGTVSSGGSVLVTDVDRGGYRPSEITVRATLDGWNLPVSIGAVPPPATRCEVLDASGNVDPSRTCSLAFTGDLNGDPAAWQVRVTVSTTSSTSVPWRAHVDLADTTLVPFVAARVGEYTGGFLTSPVTCSSASRTVTFTGRSDWGYNQVSSAQTRVIDLNGTTTAAGGGGTTVYSCP